MAFTNSDYIQFEGATRLTKLRKFITELYDRLTEEMGSAAGESVATAGYERRIAKLEREEGKLGRSVKAAAGGKFVRGRPV